MVDTRKPRGVTITIQDRKAGKSKSFTIYKTSVEEVYRILRRAVEKQG